MAEEKSHAQPDTNHTQHTVHTATYAACMLQLGAYMGHSTTPEHVFTFAPIVYAQPVLVGTW